MDLGVKMDLGGRLVGYIFGAVGMALLCFAAYLYSTEAQFVADGQTALGTIIDIRVRVGGRRGARYEYREPVIRFQTVEGQTIEFVALSGSYREDLVKGDSIEIVYLPSNPYSAEIKGSGRLFTGGVVCSILGATSLVPGLVLVVIPALKRRRRAAQLARSPLRKRRIEAEVIEISRLRRDSATGKYTFKAVAQWRDPARGKMHRFESGTMEFDPAVYASVRKLSAWAAPADALVRDALLGARLHVRVHPDDPAHYDPELIRIPGIGPVEG